MIGEEPWADLAETHLGDHDRERMNQWDVEQIEEERHSAEHGELASDHAARLFRRGINAILGPSVMSRKLNEAGYLLGFRNAKNAGTAGLPPLPCAVPPHGLGSP